MNYVKSSPEFSGLPAATKILKGRPDYFRIKAADGSPENPDSEPLYLMLNLKTGCSYRCPKCALSCPRTMGKSLTLDEQTTLLEEAQQIGIKSLVVVGMGEPSEPDNFSKAISPLIEAAHQKGLTTILFTTGSQIDRTQAEFYQDHDVSIFVSLDSIDPKTYRILTGGKGDIEKVLANIQLLKEVYRQTQETIGQTKAVRLGINVTLVKRNREELDAIRQLAGDEMQFIANAPMSRGSFSNPKLWESLVGDEYESIARLAKAKSDTGGQSSLTQGVCGYFSRGISVCVDGEYLSCGYASETAGTLGNVRNVPLKQALGIYQKVRARFAVFCEKIGRVPACPLRDKDFGLYLDELKK